MKRKYSSQFPSEPTIYRYCTLITPDYAEPEDSPAESSSPHSSDSTTLMIHIFARFTLSDDPEQPDNYSVTYSHGFPFSPAEFSNDIEARRAVAWMLSDMRVKPVNDTVEKILEFGRNLMNELRAHEGRDLVCLPVEIEEVVDELPLPPEDECQEPYSVEELRLRFMATTKQLIDAPQSETCSICVEDFVVGCEATRLPCSHLYHGRCIQEWFSKSKCCPLCRSKMPC